MAVRRANKGTKPANMYRNVRQITMTDQTYDACKMLAADWGFSVSWIIERCVKFGLNVPECVSGTLTPPPSPVYRGEPQAPPPPPPPPMSARQVMTQFVDREEARLKDPEYLAYLERLKADAEPAIDRTRYGHGIVPSTHPEYPASAGWMYDEHYDQYTRPVPAAQLTVQKPLPPGETPLDPTVIDPVMVEWVGIDWGDGNEQCRLWRPPQHPKPRMQAEQDKSGKWWEVYPEHRTVWPVETAAGGVKFDGSK